MRTRWWVMMAIAMATMRARAADWSHALTGIGEMPAMTEQCRARPVGTVSLRLRDPALSSWTERISFGRNGAVFVSPASDNTTDPDWRFVPGASELKSADGKQTLSCTKGGHSPEGFLSAMICLFNARVAMSHLRDFRDNGLRDGTFRRGDSKLADINCALARMDQFLSQIFIETMGPKLVLDPPPDIATPDVRQEDH